jgi:2-oxoisovalerate dehydrogenase E1 component alpha subunit
VEEVELWSKQDHPIERLKRYMLRNNLWDEEREREWKKEARQKVMF